MPIERRTLADFLQPLAGETTPRTIGAPDIVAFGTLTGDYSRVHFDEHFSARLSHGRRIAHGLLTASLALGSLSQDAPRVMGRRNPAAHLSTFEVNYRRPVHPGDTLRTRWRAAPDAAHAALRADYQILDHADEVVGDGHLRIALPATAQAAVVVPPAPEPWPATVFDPEPGGVNYLEDFRPGSHAGETEGHTLTEAEVSLFGALTGDNGGLHCEEPFAREAHFGRRIVQPMLVFDLGFALWLKAFCRMETPDSGTAGHLCDRWQFHAPFHAGDTLYCRHQTTSVRLSRTRPDMGLLTIGLQMLNQHGAVASSGEVVMLYPLRGD